MNRSLCRPEVEGLFFGGAALLGLPALATAAGGVSAKTVGILNYALTLEYLRRWRGPV